MSDDGKSHTGISTQGRGRGRGWHSWKAPARGRGDTGPGYDQSLRGCGRGRGRGRGRDDENTDGGHDKSHRSDEKSKSIRNVNSILISKPRLTTSPRGRRDNPHGDRAKEIVDTTADNNAKAKPILVAGSENKRSGRDHNSSYHSLDNSLRPRYDKASRDLYEDANVNYIPVLRRKTTAQGGVDTMPRRSNNDTRHREQNNARHGGLGDLGGGSCSRGYNERRQGPQD
ncbi:hypothetical protein K504DRAFT_136142 [Pleomassaria siparia CBS 279.74]|uniref:Uncharacterized protein n=1 Tax=Pleomassaria siparia CBS 279.74 TaxID=1314801 RepID=A0A6G1KKK3_9PLEO|nr:hypothetical protein K504DRAFT_136142 [Pleomassaria siparia CBS 279.74]